MALEVTGKIIQKGQIQQINDTFKKREFVIEISEQSPNGMTFTNFASFQLVQNSVTAIDMFQEGDEVKVSFNIRGNKWEKDGTTRYITNLNAWRVERAMDQMGGNFPPNNFGNNMPQNNNFPPANNSGFGQQMPNSMPSNPQGPSFTPPAGGDDDLPF